MAEVTSGVGGIGVGVAWRGRKSQCVLMCFQCACLGTPRERGGSCVVQVERGCEAV